MNILVSAYACDPSAGSEPGAGWAWARAAAAHNDVWLLTRCNNQPGICAALSAEPALRIHPIYLDLPRWARWWKRGQWGIHLYYLIWQALAWRAGRRLLREVQLDVGHHITFAVDWMPAGIAWIRGLPAVWGPVGGTTGLPWGLWRWIGARGLVREASREVVTRPFRRLFGHSTCRRAAVVVAQNADTADRFRTRASKLHTRPNVVVDVQSQRDHPDPAAPQSGRRAVFSGRLIPLKGVRLAVAALAEPGAEEWSLDIYGDGPEAGALRRLAGRLDLESRVQLHGWRPREDVLRALATADAFLFPSMHDAAGWSVGEAAALGCPVVCLDRGGAPMIAGEGATTVPARGAVTKALAAGLKYARRTEPNTAWSSVDLPALVDSWYAEAIAGSAGSVTP